MVMMIGITTVCPIPLMLLLDSEHIFQLEVVLGDIQIYNFMQWYRSELFPIAAKVVTSHHELFG